MIKANNGEIDLYGTIVDIDSDLTSIMKAYTIMFEKNKECLQFGDVKEHLLFMVDLALMTEEEMEAEIKRIKEEDEDEKLLDEIINEIENADNLSEGMKGILTGLGKMLKEMGVD